jgi:AraC-like DNA-binding protein
MTGLSSKNFTPSTAHSQDSILRSNGNSGITISQVEFVQSAAEVDWAETAARCGYCDQAHLIREFRSFSGLTPLGYMAKRGPFLNYLEV